MNQKIVVPTVVLLGLLFATNSNTAISSQFYVHDIVDQLPKHPSKVYSRRDLDKVEYIVVHHSAEDNQTPLDYANYHVYTKGWPAIGYHFVIQPTGAIFLTNHVDTISYHVSGYNTKSIGICLSGDFTTKGPTSKQFKSLEFMIKSLKEFFTNTQVKGHRDFGNTQCPGTFLNDLISKYE